MSPPPSPVIPARPKNRWVNLDDDQLENESAVYKKSDHSAEMEPLIQLSDTPEFTITKKPGPTPPIPARPANRWVDVNDLDTECGLKPAFDMHFPPPFGQEDAWIIATDSAAVQPGTAKDNSFPRSSNPFITEQCIVQMHLSSSPLPQQDVSVNKPATVHSNKTKLAALEDKNKAKKESGGLLSIVGRFFSGLRTTEQTLLQQSSSKSSGK